MKAAALAVLAVLAVSTVGAASASAQQERPRTVVTARMVWSVSPV